jgi:hypothetical protein
MSASRRRVRARTGPLQNSAARRVRAASIVSLRRAGLRWVGAGVMLNSAGPVGAGADGMTDETLGEWLGRSGDFWHQVEKRSKSRSVCFILSNHLNGLVISLFFS